MTKHPIVLDLVKLSPQELDELLLKIDLDEPVNPRLCAAVIRWLRKQVRHL